MRKLPAVGGLLCLMLATGAGYLAYQGRVEAREAAEIERSRKPPGLHVDKPKHDFGKVGQFETLAVDIEIRNDYPFAVQFGDVLKSCSCTNAELTTTRLEPGASATLSVVWKTGTKHGRVADHVRIFAYRPEEPQVPVLVEIQLEAGIREP